MDEHVYVYTYRHVTIITDARAFTWLLGTTSSYIYQDIMGCNSWLFPGVFPGISIYSTDTGSVNTLYYE